VNPKLMLLPVLAVFLTLLAAGATLASSSAPQQRVTAKATASKPRPVRKAIPKVNVVLVRRLRRTVWHWQAVMGKRRTTVKTSLRSVTALRYWRRQARSVARVASHPPHKAGWLCIHRYEGSWSDSSDPYWGGLQMDRGFMSTYAPGVLLRRGWADRWTALEQMWVAERAHRSGRGYWPWPNTARSCGLI
jgi:hypothetical protein